MIFACKNCGAKYRVPEEKISGRKFKSRCKKCGGWIFIVAMPTKVIAETKKTKDILKDTAPAAYKKKNSDESAPDLAPPSPPTEEPSDSSLTPISKSSTLSVGKKYWLRIVGGESAGVQFPLPVNETCVIGGSSTADITISDDVVSRNHAQVVVQGDTVILEDLGSTNGTFVNGSKIARAKITTDDAILVGLTILNLVNESGPDSFRESTAGFEPPSLVEDKAWPATETRENTRRFAQFALLVVQGANKGTKFSLPLDSGVIIGAGRNADIALDDDVASRKHAQIWVQKGKVQVTDLGSTNGTYLNGRKVHRASLTTSDQLLIGRTILQIIDVTI